MNASLADPTLSSRGHLLVDYFHADTQPSAYIDQLLKGTKKYSPFNLVVGNYSTDLGFNFSYGSNVLGCSDKGYELQPGMTAIQLVFSDLEMS